MSIERIAIEEFVKRKRHVVDKMQMFGGSTVLTRVKPISTRHVIVSSVSCVFKYKKYSEHMRLKERMKKW